APRSARVGQRPAGRRPPAVAGGRPGRAGAARPGGPDGTGHRAAVAAHAAATGDAARHLPPHHDPPPRGGRGEDSDSLPPRGGGGGGGGAPPAAPPAGFGALAPARAAELDWPPRQQQFLHDLVARYSRRTAKSKAHVQEHRRHHADPRTATGFTRTWKEIVYP